MKWHVSHRADKRAVKIADRHYNRQKPGSPQFVPPGRCLVLVAPSREAPKAVWATTWPFAEYVKHAWAGAWTCSIFRNEGAGLSSDLIRQAVAATRWKWPDVPELGMITFVDRKKVRGPNPGYCYLKAGFRKLAEKTKGGLIVLQMLEAEMPEAVKPNEVEDLQGTLWASS